MFVAKAGKRKTSYTEMTFHFDCVLQPSNTPHFHPSPISKFAAPPHTPTSTLSISLIVYIYIYQILLEYYVYLHKIEEKCENLTYYFKNIFL